MYVQKKKDEGSAREGIEVIENAFAQTLATDDEGFVSVEELRRIFTYQTAETTDALTDGEYSEFCAMFGLGGANSKMPLAELKRHPCWQEPEGLE